MKYSCSNKQLKVVIDQLLCQKPLVPSRLCSKGQAFSVSASINEPAMTVSCTVECCSVVVARIFCKWMQIHQDSLSNYRMPHSNINEETY